MVYNKQVDFLLHAFHNVHSMSYVDPSYSLVRLALPQALQRPGLLHAFAACGAAILSRTDPRWESTSLAHHIQATRSIATALDDLGGDQMMSNDDEWFLASINLLHIFETLRNHPKGRPNTLHLAAAHQIYGGRASAGSIQPMTILRRRVLGEFIFQLAIASTFHPSFFETEHSFLYVHNLLEKVGVNQRERRKSETINQETKICSVDQYLEMFENPVFDWIFRLSYLRTRVPLTGQYLTEAVAILAYMRNWRPLTSLAATHLPREMIAMAEIHRIAGLIFAHKILDPSLKPRDLAIQSYVRQGTALLNTFPKSKLKDTSVMIWPIFFLGLAAITTDERGSCQRPLQYLSSVCGIGCTRGILALLDHAWAPQSTSSGSNEGLALDVLFRDDLLSQIIF
ncbi:hypothetical protein A1O1_07390 [Capronia coronata CBS 617.96]|uniref:Transcription factor domain-containing protein n=1 Tax=Capronia coronata CBS 617.96 TaxID=1182541 RepID=W9XU49_9EURO|nr:uncharacterized protein A1O1_07390 [Capronia coronata CBS 617.96]EXJ83763.1 hypothetical protein A1O1_07390 [Capronia coronata CBS 617.96]